MKQQLSTVTNIQLTLERHAAFIVPSPQYVETQTHRRYFANFGQYIAALYDDAVLWDEGRPEWQRNRPQSSQLGGQ